MQQANSRTTSRTPNTPLLKLTPGFLRRQKLWKQQTQGTPERFQKMSIHPNFSQKMSQVVGTHSSPFMQALEYRKWATNIRIMELENSPVSSYCLTAADRVNRKSWSHEAFISANIFKSKIPILGFRIEPMKKSQKMLPDIRMDLLLMIPHMQIQKDTRSPLIIDVTIMLPRFSTRKVIENIPVQQRAPTMVSVAYQEYKALHRQLYCLFSSEGTGSPFTTGPGITQAKITWRIMKPQQTANVWRVGMAFASWEGNWSHSGMNNPPWQNSKLTHRQSMRKWDQIMMKREPMGPPNSITTFESSLVLFYPI